MKTEYVRIPRKEFMELLESLFQEPCLNLSYGSTIRLIKAIEETENEEQG